jgi:hypothetical protein
MEDSLRIEIHPKRAASECLDSRVIKYLYKHTKAIRNKDHWVPLGKCVWLPKHHSSLEFSQTPHHLLILAMGEIDKRKPAPD